MKKVIATQNAPGAIGPYSQGIVAGDLVFVSGQLPIDPATGSMPDNIKAQTEQSLKNVQAILEAEGLSMKNVVKTTCLLQNMGDFADMNEVYGTFFTEDCPARAAFQVAKLPKDALIEIEAIAYKG